MTERGQRCAVAPRMPMRARIIIEAVLLDHRIHAEDFFSLYRDKHLIAARATATQRLFDVGYTATRIGQFLKRNRSTVLNYQPHHREVKRSRHAAKTIMRHLTPEARRIVVDFAAAEHVKPELLIAEWVNERAHYEADAKARAAA